MTLTLLIDLDDTLLINNMDAFLKSYFQELSSALAPYVNPTQMMAAMSNSVQAMLINEHPGLTLEDVFDQHFYPMIGVSKAQLADVLEEFYGVVFPHLKSLTEKRPEAVELIHRAFSRGWKVIIATNPLFPATAVRQRVEWAGFPPDETDFAWISDFETSHFSKPNPAFYAEILAYLLWPNEPIVMVGNDLKDDILPVEALGLPTYWLCEEPCPDSVPPRGKFSSKGAFQDILPWLERIDQENIHPQWDTIAALKSCLLATPAALSTFAKQLDENEWNQRPKQDEWSLTEIICHLRDVDRDVNVPRIRTIQSGANPFIPGANTDPWVQERNYAAEIGADALKGFIDVRTEMIDLLNSYADKDWQKPARHAIFGPTNLRELVNFIATHDRTHLQQVWQTIQTVAIA